MSINTLALEAAANAGAIPQPPSKDDAIAGLTKYIPTESITLYIASISAQAALIEFNITGALMYWVFVVLTPLFLMLLFFHQLADARKEWKIPVGQWPWWKLISSTVAFAVWALAIPGNPIISITAENSAGGIVAAFAALLVSTILNLLAPLFEKPSQ